MSNKKCDHKWKNIAVINYPPETSVICDKCGKNLLEEKEKSTREPKCTCKNLAPASIHFKDCPLIAPQQGDWEKEFTNLLRSIPGKGVMPGLIKDFISAQIQQARAEGYEEHRKFAEKRADKALKLIPLAKKQIVAETLKEVLLEIDNLLKQYGIASPRIEALIFNRHQFQKILIEEIKAKWGIKLK